MITPRNVIFPLLILAGLQAVCPISESAASAASAAADTVLGQAPGSYRLDSTDGEVRIPFEMFRQDIRMIGEVNGRPVRMLIDNGHLWDELLFFGSARVDSLDLERTSQTGVGTEGDTGEIAADVAENVTIAFPGIEFTGQTAIITSYDPDLPNLWEGMEGQVSAAFLKHFIVSIDFEAELITLTEPDRFEYAGSGVELPLIPLPEGAWAIPGSIELSDGRVIDSDLMMDLGTGGALSIVTGGPHGVSPPERAIAATLGYSIVGPITGHFGRVRSLTLGGYRIDEPLAAFEDTQGVGAHAEIMVGMETFRRFNLVFDYPGRRLFLEPNRDFAAPMEFDMSGLFLRPTGNGEWKISRVLPGSPGDEAGLMAGDVISAIDGHPAADYRFWDLRPLMRDPGRKLRLLVRDENEVEREVTLVLRRLL